MSCGCIFVANGSMRRKSFDDAPGLSRELRSALGYPFYGAISGTRGRATRNSFKMLRILPWMVLDNGLSCCTYISLLFNRSSHIQVKYTVFFDG